MADTFVKNPVLYKGTKAQIESATMGENDFAVATDVSFYDATETDALLASKQPVGDYATNEALTSGLALKVAIAQGSENAGKILKVDDNGNVVVADESGGASLPILYHAWADHILNDMSWLRADTFSWQDGGVYVAAWNHLKTEYLAAKTAQSSTPYSETIAGTTIYYWLAADGHKIVTVDQESNVTTIYNDTGIAWYYIVDTDNQQFKLPRKNPNLMLPLNKTAIVGTTSSETLTADTIGDAMTMRVTNTGATPTTNTVLGIPKGGNGVTGWKNNNNDSLGTAYAPTNLVARSTNSISSDDGNKYLYFYVGNFEQSAMEQTAGITAETLNSKADTDLGNITSTGKETAVGWGVPDYSAEILLSGWGTATSNFSVPTDGVLHIIISSTSATEEFFVDEKMACALVNISSYTGWAANLFPVSKGTHAWRTSSNASRIYAVVFYPFKGVN